MPDLRDQLEAALPLGAESSTPLAGGTWWVEGRADRLADVIMPLIRAEISKAKAEALRKTLHLIEQQQEHCRQRVTECADHLTTSYWKYRAEAHGIDAKILRDRAHQTDQPTPEEGDDD